MPWRSPISPTGPWASSSPRARPAIWQDNPAPAVGPSATFTVDNVAPAISISGPSSTFASTGPVTYTVTYTDANFSASTLAAANVQLNATGTATATVTVTGSGSTRTVSPSNLTGSGPPGITLAAGTATDQAGNTASALGC